MAGKWVRWNALDRFQPLVKLMPFFRLVFLILIMSVPNMNIISVGAGSYTTDLPPDQQAPQTTIYRSEALADRPMPTNDWWSALAWRKPGNGALFAHPLALSAQPGGLGVSYPNVPFIATNGDEYRFRYFEEFYVGVDSLNSTPVVADFSDWTVTADWDNGKLRATMGHGLPYVYFTTTGGEVEMTFRLATTLVPDGTGSVVAEGRPFGIFAPEGTEWTVEGNTIRAPFPAGGYFSIAVLPDTSPETFAEFRAHAFAFVTGGRVEWQYDEAASSVTTTFTADVQVMEGTEDQPFMALYRHQWLHTDAINTAYTYSSARGEMRVLRGNNFSTTMTYPGVLPYLPAVAVTPEVETSINRMARFNDALRLNLPGPNGEMDTYWTGKGLGRVAMLAPVADQLGNAEARDAFVETLKTTLENWLSVADDGTLPHFYYDANWGALIGYPAASFGYQTSLNDHHFHHGYFVMAAAIVALYDPAWAEQWGGMIDLLIRDANSPDANDPLFPRLRGFDPYAGHSWASGANEGNDGANQESSSEAMNFAAALILWGAATGNTDIRDLGVYLYTTEAIAIDQYWFDVDDAVFPEGYEPPAAGIVWSNGADYTTWWTEDPEAIHAINFLPITPASLYLGRNADYVRRNLDYLSAGANGIDSFGDIIQSYHGLIDPAAALTALGGSYQPEWGETQAHTLQWLGVLRQYGQVDPTVTADTPHYAVFTRDGQRTYIAYNYGGDVREVTFSDGVTLTVEPHSLAVR